MPCRLVKNYELLDKISLTFFLTVVVVLTLPLCPLEQFEHIASIGEAVLTRKQHERLMKSTNPRIVFMREQQREWARRGSDPRQVDQRNAEHDEYFRGIRKSQMPGNSLKHKKDKLFVRSSWEIRS